MTIRLTIDTDISALANVADATGLFPGEMLPDMVTGFLSGDDDTRLWLTCEVDKEAVGFCFATAEPLTDGTWNMRAIAVHPERQGHGLGRALVQEIEKCLLARGQRLLIVDTSGTDAFAPTRAFYRTLGYAEEARIRSFWADGDDKVVFWKLLA